MDSPETTCNSRRGKPRLLKNHQLFLVVSSLCVVFAFQGSRGLYGTTEGRYAECAREMIETGQWLMPQLAYQPHWTKPPLTYWAIAGGVELLGRNAWGVRLYAALAFILSVQVLRQLGTVMWDRQCGYVAGLIYATSALSTLAANTVNADTLLSLWEMLAVLSYWRARLDRSSKQKLWAMALWFFSGLAFLTKGPPALLPLLVILTFHLYLWRTDQQRPKLAAVWGIPIMLVVGLWWYALEALQHPYLLSYLVTDELIGRIFTGEFDRYGEWYHPLTMYLPFLLFGIGLWLIYWPKIIARYKQIFIWSRLKAILRTNDRLAFLLIWLGLPLIILSLASSRGYLYILPFFPPVVLATARGLVRLYQRKDLHRICLITAIVSACLLVLGKGIWAHIPLKRDMERLYQVCLAQRRGNTGYFVYGNKKLYGLQFYFDGQLMRIPKDTGRVDNPALKNIIAQILDQPRYDTYVFVVRNQHRRRELEETLVHAGLAYRFTEMGDNKTVLAVSSRRRSHPPQTPPPAVPSPETSAADRNLQ